MFIFDHFESILSQSRIQKCNFGAGSQERVRVVESWWFSF